LAKIRTIWRFPIGRIEEALRKTARGRAWLRGVPTAIVASIVGEAGVWWLIVVVAIEPAFPKGTAVWKVVPAIVLLSIMLIAVFILEPLIILFNVPTRVVPPRFRNDSGIIKRQG
jgi:hypothetical protein